MHMVPLYVDSLSEKTGLAYITPFSPVLKHQVSKVTSPQTFSRPSTSHFTEEEFPDAMGGYNLKHDISSTTTGLRCTTQASQRQLIWISLMQACFLPSISGSCHYCRSCCCYSAEFVVGASRWSHHSAKDATAVTEITPWVVTPLSRGGLKEMVDLVEKTMKHNAMSTLLVVGGSHSVLLLSIDCCHTGRVSGGSSMWLH